MKKILVLPFIIFLFACESKDSAFDRGYSDGYVVGYESICNPRSVLIDGDFDNANYRAGYNAGERSGITDGSKSCMK